MAKKLYEESEIQDIADAIRAKNGSSDTYTVSQMSTAIANLPSGGSAVELFNGTSINSITVSDSLANYSYIVGFYLQGEGGNYELIGMWKYMTDIQYNDRRFCLYNPFDGTNGGFMTFKVTSETTLEYYDGASFTQGKNLVIYGIA